MSKIMGAVQRYMVSLSTVQRIMKNTYEEHSVNKDILPEAICIDEFKSTKNIDGAMSFVFADATSNKLIDIVEDRHLNSLIEYFGRFSLKARNNVKYIVSDMYMPYISLAQELFPNAQIVLDKFHIVNLISTAFNKTRIAIMKELKDESSKNKLKKFWKLFLKPYEALSTESKYCRSFRTWLSSRDKLNKMLKFDKKLDKAYNLYQRFLQLISNKNFKKFKETITTSLEDKENLSKLIITALKTFKKFLKHIENMFKTNYINGLIEEINNKIKAIKRTAFGYRNFQNLRKRALIEFGIVKLSASF